jgi:CBS domain-containing protein
MSPRAAWRLESLGFPDVRDYAGGKLDWLAFDLPIQGAQAAVPRIASAMRADAPTCRLDDPVTKALDAIAAGDWSWCGVLNAEGIVLGRLRRKDAEAAPSGALAVEVMEEGPATYRPDVPCEELVEAMVAGGFELAFVSDPDGRWRGLVSREDAEAKLRESRPGAAG